MKARFKARFSWAIAALPLLLASAVAPVWCEPPAESTTTVGDDARRAGHAVAHGATTAGHTVADKSRHAGHEIASGTRSARDTVRDDSKKTGHAIADGARNIGRKVHEGVAKLKVGVTGKSSEPAPKS